MKTAFISGMVIALAGLGFVFSIASREPELSVSTQSVHIAYRDYDVLPSERRTAERELGNRYCGMAWNHITGEITVCVKTLTVL